MIKKLVWLVTCANFSWIAHVNLCANLSGRCLERAYDAQYATGSSFKLHDEINRKSKSNSTNDGLAKFFQFFKRNYTLYESVVQNFPNGIQIFTINGRRILRISGNELDPKRWKHELNLLEFVKTPNFFHGLHLTKISFDGAESAYFYEFLLTNVQSLQTLEINSCAVIGLDPFDWDLSFFTSLEHFELSQMRISIETFNRLMERLPVSLKSLKLSLTNTIYRRVLRSMLIQMRNLEMLKFESVETERYPCILPIFELEYLNCVHFSGTSIGNVVLRELAEYAPKWTELTIKDYDIQTGDLISLRNLHRLVNLDLTNSNIRVEKGLKLLDKNIHSFPNLRHVNLSSNLMSKEIVFPIAIAQSNIKIQLDYKECILSAINWRNYCIVLTGIVLNLQEEENLAMHLVNEVKCNPSFSLRHVTSLTIKNCSLDLHFALFLQLIACMPSLKELSLNVIGHDFDLLGSRPGGIAQQLELLSIAFWDNQNAEIAISFITAQFRHVKRLVVASRLSLDPKQFTKFHLLSVQELVLDVGFDFNQAATIFLFASQLPNLQILSLRFGKELSDDDGEANKIGLALIRQLPFSKLKEVKLRFCKIPKNFSDFAAFVSNLACSIDLHVATYDEEFFDDMLAGLSVLMRIHRLEICGLPARSQINRLLELDENWPFLESLVCHCTDQSEDDQVEAVKDKL